MTRRGAKPRSSPAERRMAARHDVLEQAMEGMLALIRFHIGGCPRCASAICSGGMEGLLRRIDADLRASAQALAATTAPAPPTRRRRVKRVRRPTP